MTPHVPALPRACARIPLIALLLTACGGGGGGGAPNPTPVPPTLVFGPPAAFAHGGAAPADVALVDLDRDGLPDVLLLHQGTSRLTVLPGGLGGALQPAVASTLGGSPAHLALGDLNGDRRPDLVTAGSVVAELGVSLGDGSRSFPAITTRALADTARDLVLGDFDGDGRLDAAVAHATSATLTVVSGDGAGGFGAPRQIALPGIAGLLAVADFNGDTRLDLATSTGASLVVLLQTAGGQFTTSTPVALGGTVGLAPAPLAVGDLDGDRDTDLVVWNRTTGEVMVLLGDGAGGFTVRETLPAAGTTALLLADLDVDGRLDLLLATATGVSARYGAAAGFGPAEALLAGGTAVTGLTVSDVDLDGLPDLVLALGADRVGVLRNPKAATPSVELYGAGTPGCRGAALVAAVGAPTIGNAGFRLIGHNAPASTFGFLLLGGPPDVAGSDPFGLGFLLHLGQGLVTNKLWFTDAAGIAYSNEPVPNNSRLVGLAVYAQALWQERAGGCSMSPLGIVSSRGLRFTFAQ